DRAAAADPAGRREARVVPRRVQRAEARLPIDVVRQRLRPAGSIPVLLGGGRGEWPERPVGRDDAAGGADQAEEDDDAEDDRGAAPGAAEPEGDGDEQHDAARQVADAPALAGSPVVQA